MLVTWHFDIWQCVQQKGDFREGPLGFTVKQEICPGLLADPYPNQFMAGICAVSVYTDDEVHLLALFGDSVTHMGYFSDPLTEFLYHRYPGKIAVINGGICGNRIARDYPKIPLLPGGGHQFGAAGKDRFLRNLYSEAVPDLLFIMEGVNDSTHSLLSDTEENETPEHIFEAIEEVTQEAEKRGSRVLIATIMPFGSDGMPFRELGNQIRVRCNELLREKIPAEKLIDLDEIMRDPDDIFHLQDGMHLGDGVHPNTFGGKKMAEAVFSRWFK